MDENAGQNPPFSHASSLADFGAVPPSQPKSQSGAAGKKWGNPEVYVPFLASWLNLPYRVVNKCKGYYRI